MIITLDMLKKAEVLAQKLITNDQVYIGEVYYDSDDNLVKVVAHNGHSMVALFEFTLKELE